MNKKQTIKSVLLGLFAVLSGSVATLSLAYADSPSCAGVSTSIITCPKQTGGTCKDKSIPVSGRCADGSQAIATTLTTSGLWGLLLLVINILTAGIGVAAVGGVVYGSILYSSAGGAAEQVKKAKTVITNVIIGLVAYGLMYAFLNFLIPGGLFN